MKKNIWPAAVEGSLTAPPSKSEAQRAIVLAAMAQGRSKIVRPGTCEDVLSVIDVCEKLGASVTQEGDSLIVDGGFRRPDSPLDCGESGLAIRMFSALAALFDKEVVLTGKGSLTRRPLPEIEKTLTALGVTCTTRKGFLPVHVTGPWKGGQAHTEGSSGSQIITGVLMASAVAPLDTSLFVKDLKSKPYTDLTIEIMNAFGVEATHVGHRHFFVSGGQQYQPSTFETGGDWSGAAYMLVAGAIAGRIRVKGLDGRRSQADRLICEALKRAGAQVVTRGDSVETRKDRLQAFRFDASDCPDLFPPLVALAAHCEGNSVISGLHRLYTKESNRAGTLKDCFGRMGIGIRFHSDEMIVSGGKPRSAGIDSHGDHRIAMAAAVAALGGDGPVCISGAEAVSKSYPAFFNDLQKISRL